MRDAAKRRVVFDADPSPDAEIMNEAIDPGSPLGIMDQVENIVGNPTDVTRAVGIPGQKTIPEGRIVDAGQVEECAMDIRELVGSLF